MHGGHPPAFGDQHPWLDPLAPQDIFDPRPDAELGMLGGLAPDPQAFAFTPQGRAEYHDAVRAQAHQMQSEQMMRAMQFQAAQSQAARAAADGAAAARRRAAFLLLSP